MQKTRILCLLAFAATVAACSNRNNASVNDQPIGTAPSATTAQEQLDRSPRHGEFVMIPAEANDSVRAYVVYPERSSNAPVVVVVHEIFGLSTWIRSVADQLAAEGFIAVAPDFLTGKPGISSQEDSVLQRVGPAIIRQLTAEEIQRRLTAAANYGMSQPAATKRYGVVGFCWGGGTVFQHALASREVGGVVVYYGSNPEPSEAPRVNAPILGLYGGDDARVNQTIAPMQDALAKLNKQYEVEIYDGAGHGFLRQQDGRNGANLAAARQAWPRTVSFFRQTLGH